MSRDPVAILVVQAQGPSIVAMPEEAPPAPLAFVAQGVRGLPGVSGGVSYVQDHPPIAPQDKQTWYNPLTLQLQVYTAAGWRPVSPDGGHF